MKLTNQQIYDAAVKLAFFNIEGKLPVRINFFLQKNIQMLMAAGREIEEVRMKIAQDYGELDANSNQFTIPPARMNEAQTELNDLFGLEQDLNIHIFKLDEFDDIELTYDQLSAIMFMIEE